MDDAAVPRRLPALVFDFGNVVAYFDYARACGEFGRRVGLSGEAFLQRLRDRGLAGAVARFESGECPPEEFAGAVAAMAGLVIPYQEFAAAWSDIFWANEPLAGIIGGLKARGYTLVLGSNTNALHAAQFRRQFPETLGHFDRLVLSHEVGRMKPSPVFYRACAAAAGAPAAACAFIDDLPENVRGARDAGLAGVLYRDPEALLTDLAALGVDTAGLAPTTRAKGPANPPPAV